MRSVPYCSCNTRMVSQISFPQRLISTHHLSKPVLSRKLKWRDYACHLERGIKLWFWNNRKTL